MLPVVIVRFRKARHAERPHTFTCIRDDGTTTGQASTEFFVRHDLTHFAVESVLEFREAFYGLLSEGWEVTSFEERDPGSRKSRKLPPEAIAAEIIAGDLDRLLGLSWRMTGPQITESVAGQLESAGLGFPHPSIFQIERILGMRKELLIAWSALAPGQTMELVF